jgi:endo-1,4-beta-xylanase
MFGKSAHVRACSRQFLWMGVGALTLTLVAAVAGGRSAAAEVHHDPALAMSRGVHSRRSLSVPPQLGAAVNTVMLDSADPRYVRTLLRHYGSVTPEYEMEMSQLEPAKGRFDFARADRIVSFAARHHLPVRGHTLVWDQMIPGWVTQAEWTPAQLRRLLHTYIRTVVGHYRGRVGEWDVVNEPLTADGSLRQNIWERVIGPGYIALAFRWAHRADPHATLFVNEYGAEWSDPKARALHRLVAGLRATHVPVSGVGFQAHFSLDAHPPQAEFTGVLRSFARLGVHLEVTELDVAAAGRAPLGRRLAEEAAAYRSAAGACRAVRACGRVTTWGITDAASWLGSTQRGLPFAADYQAKPAWWALRAALGR